MRADILQAGEDEARPLLVREDREVPVEAFLVRSHRLAN